MPVIVSGLTRAFAAVTVAAVLALRSSASAAAILRLSGEVVTSSLPCMRAVLGLLSPKGDPLVADSDAGGLWRGIGSYGKVFYSVRDQSR